MYIKVYVNFWNGNESANPFLISDFTKNDNFLRKWQKSLFWEKNLGQPTKHNFELKVLKLLVNQKAPCVVCGVYYNVNIFNTLRQGQQILLKVKKFSELDTDA